MTPRRPIRRPPLVLVTNRGPVTFERRRRSVKRGSGGLVTALTGLASHRDAVWIASAMSEDDAEVAREHGGRAFPVALARGRRVPRAAVESDPEAYDRFYNVVANPMLWFIQHYLWDLSNAPDIRRHEVEAFEFGYNAVNEDLARAVRRGDRGRRGAGRDGPRLPPLHAARRSSAARGRTRSCTTSSTSRGPSRTPGACCPRASARRSSTGLLANDIIGFHTRSYRRNFLQCCRDLMDLEVDFERGRRALSRTARCGCAPTRCRSTPTATRQVAQRARVARVRAGAAAPPPRPPDPARRPRRPVEERAARVLARSTCSSSSTRSSASASRSSPS